MAIKSCGWAFQIVLCLVVPACGVPEGESPASKPGEATALAPAADSALASRDDAVVERPIWAFGEDTQRRDALPLELDSLREWQGIQSGRRPQKYAVAATRQLRELHPSPLSSANAPDRSTNGRTRQAAEPSSRVAAPGRAA
jgi:hypothetical protein